MSFAEGNSVTNPTCDIEGTPLPDGTIISLPSSIISLKEILMVMGLFQGDLVLSLDARVSGRGVSYPSSWL